MSALPPAGGSGRRRRRGDASEVEATPARSEAYRQLRPPFPAVPVFTEDRVVALHEAALGVLEELGMVVLLPEARALFRAAGAAVDEDSGFVRIGREI
ncbi:MAG: trimethylamine methyltransferase family protein, partial [Pseudomonadota bacterium]